MTAAVGPPPSMAAGADELTPMLAQYYELCTAYEDSLVLFQVGDFYEAFCEAAEAVARICEVTLTQREDSTGEYPMAGIPIDNAASYIEPLLAVDVRVAIADQVEDAEEASGLVDRAVTRVVTPGTLTDDELLPTGSNYAACVTRGETVDAVDSPTDSPSTVDGAATCALAAVDVSTGECRVTSAADPARIADELERLAPAELLVGPDTDLDIEPLSIEPMVTGYETTAFTHEAARDTVVEYADPDVLGGDAEVRACGALLSYAEYTQGDDGKLSYVSRLTRYDPRDRLGLDATALRSLELFERRGAASGQTLLDVVDETASAPGRRQLTDWLRRPLLDGDTIAARHGAVETLLENALVREELHDHLREVYDVERLLSRASRGRANARDLRSLKATLDVIPDVADAVAAGVQDTASETEGPLLAQLRAELDDLADVRSLIGEAIHPDPPQEITEGGVIREGFDPELDELRETEQEGRAWVADLEARERERTGIDSLEVGYNQVHGYYIEVTDAHLDQVPEDYTRRQTLKNAERFYTAALKRREDEILGATERADTLEHERFREVREDVAAEADRITAVADALASLDALVSLATVAAREGWTRPEMGADGLSIEAGRHPVVEQTQGSFVPNDTHLGPTPDAAADAAGTAEGTATPDPRVAIITGPNMSGKSTYMRQVALICTLAQAGSFVPAEAASLPVLDRVFTRVGASDDIAGGQSTFMREMSELTDILHRATERSLVLLDEVGRGTSTADGLAIARATTEFIDEEVGAYTLFATHYHDLTDLAETRAGVVNRHFTATREDGDVTFLHQIAEGPSSSSYGIEVAQLAGVPSRVVDRSRELVTGTPESQTARLDRWTETPDTAAENGAITEPSPAEAVDRPASGSTAESPATDGAGSAAVSETEPEPDSEPTEASDPAHLEVAAQLRALNLARTTPMEALNQLHELQRRLEGDR